MTSFLIGLGIATLIGSIVGGASYVASELVSYSITGEFSWSWADFTGGVIGGAIGGALVYLQPNGAFAAFISGVATSAISMNLENAWEGKSYTTREILFASLFSGIISSMTGVMFDCVPIKGLNSGRGSYAAVTKQIATKFRNGTIKRISYKTFFKMLTYNMAGSTIDAGVSGIIGAAGT